MTAPTIDNPAKTVNRYKKARKLADYLRDNGIVEIEPQALIVNDFLRVTVAKAAQVNEPSEDTWFLVAYLLEEGR